jgi:hypothetical protein
MATSLDVTAEAPSSSNSMKSFDAGAKLRAICWRAHLGCSLNSVDRSFAEPLVGAIHSFTVEICHRPLVRRSWTQAQPVPLDAWV